MTYQTPTEGFRGEVTAAAKAELVAYSASIGEPSRLHCPSCGRDWPVREESAQEHAEGCIELRSDVAESL